MSLPTAHDGGLGGPTHPTMGRIMSFQEQRPPPMSGEVPQHASVLRIALAEIRAANLETALDDMRRQRDMWRERAARLAATGRGRTSGPPWRP
jgi:hypothetical protein